MSSTGDVAVQSWARSRASFPPNFRPEPWKVEFVIHVAGCCHEPPSPIGKVLQILQR